MAMSVYPEKSKYNWKVYAIAPLQASKKDKVTPVAVAENASVAYGARLSASKTFLHKPKVNSANPIERFL